MPHPRSLARHAASIPHHPARRGRLRQQHPHRKYAEPAWGIEVYHRGLKQHCGVERAQVRAARAQRNHSGCALRAFLRLEVQRLGTGVSWWAAKTAIIRTAIRAYLAAPLDTLTATASLLTGYPGSERAWRSLR